MKTIRLLKGAALLSAMILAGCSTKKEPQAPARQPADVKSQIQQLLPSDVTQKSAWADDIYT
ncbi:DUF1615 domain-containing protein, partial [Serratia bockelmannii]|nr:DUF1615 domain-containing protein [Serratia bockelmannii]